MSATHPSVLGLAIPPLPPLPERVKMLVGNPLPADVAEEVAKIIARHTGLPVYLISEDYRRSFRTVRA